MISAPTHAVERKHRRGRPSKLRTLLRYDRAAYDQMLKVIGAGAFACDAASLLGIAPETFCRWMARGASEHRGIFGQFRQDVLQAQAVARAEAEIRVARENPLAWLRYGPGRTRKGLPGWTDHAISDHVDPEAFHVRPHAVEASSASLADMFKLGEELGWIAILPAGRETYNIKTSSERMMALTPVTFDVRDEQASSLEETTPTRK